MEQNNSPDELIEIKPDAGHDVEEDIKIYKTGATEDVVLEADKESAEAAEEIRDDVIPVEELSDEEVDNIVISTNNLESVEDITEDTTENDTEDNSEDITDDYAEEIAEMEHEEEDRRLVKAIGDSLSKQVDSEFERSIIMIPDVADTGYNTGDGDDPDGSDPEEDEDADEPAGNIFTRIPWWGYMVAGVVLVLIIMFTWVMTSGPGKRLLVKWGSKYAAEKITYIPVNPVDETGVFDETDDPGVDINREDLEVIPGDYSVVTPEIVPSKEPEETAEDPNAAPVDVQEQKVFNILLIGEENMTDSVRGRSDMLMIATINSELESVKLTSIMRDCLVAIPGHLDNRINVAYTIGGVSLLYNTLKVNLGVDIDNYILVNFDNFEDIIDALGGVDINLTAEEANYLNTTNYISNPEYRTVSAGANHLNGNQALGFCRIRAVGTSGNEYSDFGRTSRQRTVLNRVYSSAAGKSYFELMGVANKCLSFVTTDLTAEDIEKYVGLILSIGIDKGIENYRIPVSGTFSEALLRDMIVTKIDLQANAEALSKIIYGN